MRLKLLVASFETYGRGSTREASDKAALTKWKAKFAHVTEVTAYNFQIEVKGNNLTVTRPGSGFRAVYHKSAGQQELTLRKRTECEDHELLLQAWEAAILKARELGWIT